jgi:hypothetical protein
MIQFTRRSLLVGLGAVAVVSGEAARASIAARSHTAERSHDSPHENNIASEYFGVALEEAMTSADMLALLGPALGNRAGDDAVFERELRRGVFLTSRVQHQGTVVALQFHVSAGNTQPQEKIAEVAISARLGQTFFDLVQSALTTAEALFAATGFGAPWELLLHAENPFGAEEVEITVSGDARAQFLLSWKIESPDRPIDDFVEPAARQKRSQEHVRVTVHFPITLAQFVGFVDRAYGRNAPERFTAFPLTPHRWLLLTVTGDQAEPDDRVVQVRFDAVTVTGAQHFIAEAPASTAVGQRFVDESVARMQEMLDEEAQQPGSSRKWLTDFFYDDPKTGAITVAVIGEKGLFAVSYTVETPPRKVRRLR